MLNDDPAGPQYGQKRFCEWLPSELRDALDEAEAECEGKMAELDNAAEPRLGRLAARRRGDGGLGRRLRRGWARFVAQIDSAKIRPDSPSRLGPGPRFAEVRRGSSRLGRMGMGMRPRGPLLHGLLLGLEHLFLHLLSPAPLLPLRQRRDRHLDELLLCDGLFGRRLGGRLLRRRRLLRGCRSSGR